MDQNQKIKNWIEKNELDNIPEIIYRFDKLEIGLNDILFNQTIKFSNPSSFNDPFDLYEGLFDLTLSNADARRHAIYLKTLHGSHLSERELSLEMRRNKPGIKKTILKTLAKTKACSGIACFSAAPKHPLLWAHYALKHTGICIGFSRNLLYSKLYPETWYARVRYTENIEPLNYFKERHLTLVNWVFTKSNVWSYEKEVRIFSRECFGITPFDPIFVKEIIFGCRVDENEIKNAIDKLKKYYPHVKFKKMRIKKTTFELEPIDINC